jgi:DNA (cytosine-5)-methyltransferase 1
VSGLTHGGLFEGYGGTTMAAETVLGPLDRRWHSDIKPASVALLAHHHPDVPNLGDLTAIDWTQVEPVDVLTASWPCQPHSSAGKQLGEEDPRALWPHVADAIAALRPRVVLGETVDRIAGSGELRRVTRSLAALGYVGAWRCVSAAAVGAPHLRPRCFIAAVDPGRFDPPATGAGAARFPFRLSPDALLPTPTARDGRRGAGWGDQPGRPLSETIHRFLGSYDADETDWLTYRAGIRRWGDTLGRPAPAPLVASLRAPYGPALSARFCEWLMGLPEGWVTGVGGLGVREVSDRVAQIDLLGDGVVPQQGAAAFAACLDDLVATTGEVAA